MSVVKKDKSGKENPEWGGAWLTFSQGSFPKGLFMKKNGTHVPSLCEIMVCTFPKDQTVPGQDFIKDRTEMEPPPHYFLHCLSCLKPEGSVSEVLLYLLHQYLRLHHHKPKKKPLKSVSRNDALTAGSTVSKGSGYLHCWRGTSSSMLFLIPNFLTLAMHLEIGGQILTVLLLTLISPHHYRRLSRCKFSFECGLIR